MTAGRIHYRSQRSGGFTLLELVLVMIIICTAVAIAAPKLGGWSRGTKLRNSADEFMTLARYARSRAITDAVPYRINFDTRAGTYQVLKRVSQREQADPTQQADSSTADYGKIPGEIGREYHVPDGGQVGLEIGTADKGHTGGEWITFYPNGRTEAAKLRISDGKGFEIEVRCDSPAEDFYVTYEGTQRNG